MTQINSTGKFFLVAVDSEALKEAFAKARSGSERVIYIVAAEAVWMGEKKGGIPDLIAVDLEALSAPSTATIEEASKVLTTRKEGVDPQKHNALVRLDT